MTGAISAIVEAWQELRIHKTRVLLSLIGVAVAVCAITVVVGIGGIAEQASRENGERGGGRAATISISASQPAPGQPSPGQDAPSMETVWPELLQRYDVTYASRVLQGSATVQFPDGAVTLGATAVDPPYATMHRLQLAQGSWFAADDAERRAPALVVNPAFWERIGSPPLGSHPTVQLLGDGETTAVIVGVVRASSWETEPALFMLYDAYSAAVPSDPTMPMSPQYELWVPPENAEALVPAIQSDLTATLGASAGASVNRSDWGAFQQGDPFLPLKLMIAGVAALVLLLGALGLVNIALVTVRYRIREIGIRRSFGASGARVFFAVMLESVVGTVVAGLAGVAAAVLIVTSPWMRDLISQGMVSDFPPFPVEAALLGLGAATLVGALAGLLPALVAVRVKVIDAIRY